MAESRDERFVTKLNFSDPNLLTSWKLFKQFDIVKVAKNMVIWTMRSK